MTFPEPKLAAGQLPKRTRAGLSRIRSGFHSACRRSLAAENFSGHLWIKSNISAKIYGYYGYHKLGLELGSSDNLLEPSLARGPSPRSRAAALGAFWELASAYPVGNPAKGYQGRLAYRFLNSKDRGWNGAFELDWANFIPLGKRLVGAISLHFRDLDDVEARDYDLYQMGGYEMLRGYKRRRVSELASGLGGLGTALAPRSGLQTASIL